MVEPAPGWYPDPTTRHESRYWDGLLWTEHVASAGSQRTDPLRGSPMPSATAGRHRAPVLGRLGMLLCLAALVAISVPGFGYVRALSEDGVTLDSGPVDLVLPAHRTYGVYVDDSDNSGYSENCSAVDKSQGRPIQMKDPSWNISSSDTEVLDIVFDTGSGHVSISCTVPGERVTIRAVPHDSAMFLGFALAMILGIPGVGMIIAWAVIRSARQPASA